VKVAVYNRYWSTGGGAEKYAGVIADVLSQEHEVTLLGPDPIDLASLGDRLGFDLSRCSARVVRDREGAVTRASRDVDLLINASFLSDEPNEARHGLYVVHFPAVGDADLSAAQRLFIRLFGPLVRSSDVDAEWGEGFYPREGRRPRVFWTSAEATFVVEAVPDRAVPVRLAFVDRRPPGVGPAHVQVAVDGVLVEEVIVGGGAPTGRLTRRRPTEVVLEVPARADRAEVAVTITSDTFVPAEVLGGDDERPLGVALSAMHTGTGAKDRMSAGLGAWFPLLYRRLPQKRWFESYDRVVANSRFTQHWIERWWKSPSVVLYPPVVMQQRAAKDKVILNVGRFFDARSGHSKKQLEMVAAFRTLMERSGGPGGPAEGWQLHLVGGCSEPDRPYLDKVRAAAEGLPVVLHVDAPGDEVRELYGRASIYWHATGFGEDPEKDPDRLEHFGIATVEAMSGGAVPVVIGLAGQLEVLDDGVEGHHWLTLEQLVALTLGLIEDPARLGEMSLAAERRAQDFGVPAFANRLRALVAEITAD
jgi:glycosyltransferase involved in cell wall biosynthesis